MVFFGKRADAVKGKDGAANQKKKGETGTDSPCAHRPGRHMGVLWSKRQSTLSGLLPSSRPFGESRHAALGRTVLQLFDALPRSRVTALLTSLSSRLSLYLLPETATTVLVACMHNSERLSSDILSSGIRKASKKKIGSVASLGVC